MTSSDLAQMERDYIKLLCDEFKKYSHFDPSNYEKYQIKRGLRNADGTGVVAGLTSICDVHGYAMVNGEKVPDEGRLIYRGYDVNDLVVNCMKEDRYGFEETAWLLLFGVLPTSEQLELFVATLAYYREMPPNFFEDMIMKAPSPDIMNKLARSVLALYSYDDNPDDISMENLVRQSILLLARMPSIMVAAYQVKRRVYDNQNMFLNIFDPKHSIAQNILHTLRPDGQFTDEEARLLDLCLILHAEHGGGNNSTFATRVVASTQTDTYSAVAAGIGSLKGPLHGGANLQVMHMLDAIKGSIGSPSDSEIKAALYKVMDKQIGDGSGLIYGMGHAVYTKSDPRAVILKQSAKSMASLCGFEEDLYILETVERLAPEVFAEKKGNVKTISANVDFYSGLVYRMLGITSDLFTPLFACARMAGWCAHRIEETLTGGRIIRPAYKAVMDNYPYVPLAQRG